MGIASPIHPLCMRLLQIDSVDNSSWMRIGIFFPSISFDTVLYPYTLILFLSPCLKPPDLKSPIRFPTWYGDDNAAGCGAYHSALSFPFFHSSLLHSLFSSFFLSSSVSCFYLLYLYFLPFILFEPSKSETPQHDPSRGMSVAMLLAVTLTIQHRHYIFSHSSYCFRCFHRLFLSILLTFFSALSSFILFLNHRAWRWQCCWL